MKARMVLMGSYNLASFYLTAAFQSQKTTTRVAIKHCCTSSGAGVWEHTLALKHAGKCSCPLSRSVYRSIIARIIQATATKKIGCAILRRGIFTDVFCRGSIVACFHGSLGAVCVGLCGGALRVFELYYDVAVILHAGTSPWMHAMTKSRGRKPVATQ